ncbi:peptidylprolyl isomerase [Novosphingobium album (ex Liu et al. 2023)]|uniref:peptidylprolyl isomerase n=1 Tax=Novosphingobium album (ex Liu et al. 2023) TaxID=3031130 RepID=A0ABT5WSM1_9SPHN|nr:peptidylprolyl isomerase [Novosphingobium album (ex Liu et al. 2023)]MDE8653046.1 peptidylprolyl isomerase [Novosphingobium album (ex Liu et al. 2023)]
MTSRFALFAAPLLMILTGAAPAPAPAPAPAADAYVAVRTSMGTITLDLDAAHAPLTTANFLRYVDQRRLDNTAFYRSMHLDWGDQPNGLVQGGIGANPALALKPVAHEPTSQTGVLHKAGAISMARYAPGTATADFSILLSDMPGLDANPDSPDPEAKAGFAAFGHVVSGMDVVRAIWDAPRSPTKGEGVMKGQMIEAPVKILSVRRVPAPVATPAPEPSATPSPAATSR